MTTRSADEYDRAVVEFLATPANIEYVFEIGERFNKVKDFLHLKFWRTVYTMTQNQIMGGWQVRIDSDTELLTKTYPYLALQPPPPSADWYLLLCLAQASSNHDLCAGIIWNKGIPTGQGPQTFANHLPAMRTLRTCAQEYSDHADTYWLSRKGFDRGIRLREKQTCIGLARNNDLETILVADLMGLFQSTHHLIETANTAIAAAIQNGSLLS